MWMFWTALKSKFYPPLRFLPGSKSTFYFYLKIKTSEHSPWFWYYYRFFLVPKLSTNNKKHPHLAHLSLSMHIVAFLNYFLNRILYQFFLFSFKQCYFILTMLKFSLFLAFKYFWRLCSRTLIFYLKSLFILF